MSLKDLSAADLTQKLSTNSAYKFSTVKMDELEETEYSLVTIVVDVTGSVANFENELLDMVKNIVKACRKAPRAENLLIRVVHFHTSVTEIHGFLLVKHIDEESDYKPIRAGGATALYDATHTSVDATLKFGEDLRDQDYGCNALVAIVTDGDDNSSSFTPDQIKKLIDDGLMREKLESIMTILIGINVQSFSHRLKQFKDEAGLTQYIDAGDATPDTIAKVGGFISDSISSQSNALGSGGQSQTLTF